MSLRKSLFEVGQFGRGQIERFDRLGDTIQSLLGQTVTMRMFRGTTSDNQQVATIHSSAVMPLGVIEATWTTVRLCVRQQGRTLARRVQTQTKLWM